jgi:HEAT repeat protein
MPFREEMVVKSRKTVRITRRILGVLVLMVGLSTTWAWGEVARLAEPAAVHEEQEAVALYAAWQPAGTGRVTLFRSTDGAATWQRLALPSEADPTTWADDGGRRVAVAMTDGSLLRSRDQGNSWTVAGEGLSVLSLVWDHDGSLYLGTDGQGVHRLADDGTPIDISAAQEGLAAARVVSLAMVENRLFAATPDTLFYTDDMAGGAAWTEVHTAAHGSPLPAPEWVTAIAATDLWTVYAGTANSGVFKTTDAGQTWQPASSGLGLTAGQMVRVNALRADATEPGLLYTAVDHVVGNTHAHASAAGAFVTLDGGASWQPLAGPTFPEAAHASSLVIAPGKSLYVQAVVADGLQAYGPDVVGLLAGLENNDPEIRASAARQLGLAQPLGVWNELLAALDDANPAVSQAAAGALGRINDPAAVGGLLVAIGHPQEQVRLGAAQALGMMRVEAAVEPLRSMLLLGEGAEIGVAGEALGHIGSPPAVEALLVALADPVPTARWHVAMAALERMGEPAVEPLVAMLNGEDTIARHNAAQALGWVGSQSATKALVGTLETDSDAAVRGQAAWALGEIADPAARRALEQAQLRDAVVEVRREAAWSLASVPEQPSPATRWPASWALTLSRLQAARWLTLALSLVAAAWLMFGIQTPIPGLLHRGVWPR